MNREQSPQERKLAELIVDSLNLEDLEADEIDPEKPLFGAGYGLDSIDALELTLAISANYGVELRSDDEKSLQAFSNLRSLAKHIDALQKQA